MVAPNIDREQCLALYTEHMEKARGLAEGTQRAYLLIARRFLASLGRRRQIAGSKITAPAVIEFVRSDAARRRGRGAGLTVAGTRSFLRFLRSQKIVQAGLEASVPSVRCYRHASLPPSLTEAEIAQVLKSSNDGTQKGIRNYALLLIISRLGLRIGETASLLLEDIDWINGFIVVRAGKNRCERKLPLAQDVAEAILNYLCQSRPKVDDRHIFLQVMPPFKGYDGGALGKVIHRLLVKFGMKRPSGGPHQFRHAAATKMVNQGATFKEIADLLGHRSMAATAIYAKLDFQSLMKIALPWPEVAGNEN
jgi:site-specific recombinase XerD